MGKHSLEQLLIHQHTALTRARAAYDERATERRDTIRKLRAAGWSYQRIGDLLGVSHTAVLRSARDRGAVK
jgi:DNA-directed RNA polymerase specialized sigma24 family protein